ncbi:DUF3732 domain-containing protein [Photorhabdus khanii]|uniref:Uncharacterized protein n=1 Tax=Photorhabdus khanii subsp. guanajuatensis TaxID=2100166 RepID=A0A4R4JVI2_9GAMM|nr:DUF3732 domain-containing protein [Photorhabdus khanii]TDB58112.1 hypothetical protein C5467_10055 [Photorhabdus khanii subsp. guanajuatensis]
MIGITQSGWVVFSLLVIDQIAQTGLSSLKVIYYFEKLFSAESGDNILDKMGADQDLKITRQNDIISTRRIFEMLPNAIEENSYNFQFIVLEHAGESIWGQVRNTYEVANWKDEGDGLIPKEWLQ